MARQCHRRQTGEKDGRNLHRQLLRHLCTRDLRRGRRGLGGDKGPDEGQRAFRGRGMDYGAYKEQQYDRLAEALRRHLDMDRIYEIMGVES